jgi:hypothetical protein
MTDTIADDIAAGPQTRLTYRPHLDGLRAVAVALVVAFHAGLERFLGGFIGVDVFFVLSGFLVSRILLQDLTERALHRSGRRIVILEPIPQAPVDSDPLLCLSQTRAWSECRYDANRVPTRLERHERIYARNHHNDVVSIDLDPVVCPRLPRCDPVVRNIILKRDRTHITATFARSVAGLVEQKLVRAGIVGEKK